MKVFIPAYFITSGHSVQKWKGKGNEQKRCEETTACCYCGGGIFIYGACTCNTAAYYEALHNSKGKSNQNAAAQTCNTERKNSLPYSCNSSLRITGLMLLPVH